MTEPSGLGRSLLDQTYNDAIEKAARYMDEEAYGWRSAASGSDEKDVGWTYARLFTNAAENIRTLKR